MKKTISVNSETLGPKLLEQSLWVFLKRMALSVNGVYSKIFFISSGVPQGSTAAPLFLLLYDIHLLILCDVFFDVFMVVDDTTFWYSTKKSTQAL